MILLGIDFETTGLEPEHDSIIEVGAVLYDWDNKKPVKLYSEFLEEKIPKEITALTGITQAMVSSFGLEKEKIIKDLKFMAAFADHVVAHNAKFDKAFCPVDLKKNWICTRMDIPYGKEIQSRKLHYIAADHQIINPFRHRATFDVLTMFEVLKQYNLDTVIERSKSPSIKIMALVNYDTKELAKDAGFHWNSNSKRWELELKECDLAKTKFNFKWRKI